MSFKRKKNRISILNKNHFNSEHFDTKLTFNQFYASELSYQETAYLYRFGFNSKALCEIA